MKDYYKDIVKNHMKNVKYTKKLGNPERHDKRKIVMY